MCVGALKARPIDAQVCTRPEREMLHGVVGMGLLAVRTCAVIGRAFSALTSIPSVTWGFTPGWYGTSFQP
jgi:hypothetical protein